jgi:hypothetical protein
MTHVEIPGYMEKIVFLLKIPFFAKRPGECQGYLLRDTKNAGWDSCLEPKEVIHLLEY